MKLVPTFVQGASNCLQDHAKPLSVLPIVNHLNTLYSIHMSQDMSVTSLCVTILLPCYSSLFSFTMSTDARLRFSWPQTHIPIFAWQYIHVIALLGVFKASCVLYRHHITLWALLLHNTNISFISCWSCLNCFIRSLTKYILPTFYCFRTTHNSHRLVLI